MNRNNSSCLVLNRFHILLWQRICTYFISAILLLYTGACAFNEQATVVKLAISDTGTFSLDGKPVDSAELAKTLRSMRQPNKDLLVQLILSPQTKYDSEAVKTATEAAEEAGAKVGIVGNERFLNSINPETSSSIVKV